MWILYRSIFLGPSDMKRTGYKIAVLRRLVL